MGNGEMVTVASYGGGVNSTAMLLGILERLDAYGVSPDGIKPDLILFADTGGEKPETYAYMQKLSGFLVQFGFPPIVTVAVSGESLEANCLRRKALPSIAYGFKTCSQRWKLEPQEKYMNNWTPARKAWMRGGRVTKLIGYDAGEPQRAKQYGDDKYMLRYPLIEWGWDREGCLATIARHGLCPPPKSSCFFCPNMSENEILDLRDEHPELLDRALAMERNADLVQIKGLARDMSWQQIVDYDRDQLALLPKRERTMPCECYDGE